MGDIATGLSGGRALQPKHRNWRRTTKALRCEEEVLQRQVREVVWVYLPSKCQSSFKHIALEHDLRMSFEDPFLTALEMIQTGEADQ